MAENRSAPLLRSVRGFPSRRHLLRGLAGAGLGLGSARLPGIAAAKKGKKKRKKKPRSPRPNEFGCLEVGDPCQNADQCCSGICAGTKGKKTCRAHDTGGCQPGVQDGSCSTPGTDVSCVTSTGNPEGLCGTTTGNAGYCLYSGGCYPCRKDAECRPFCGPQAACIRCDECTQTGGASCSGPDYGACAIPSGAAAGLEPAPARR